MLKPSFLSKRTERAAYYCLNMATTGREPLAIVCGGWEVCRPDYRVQRHTFRYHAIEFVAEGLGELLLAGRRFRLAPGLAFCYGPGMSHRIRTDAGHPMLKYFIDFTGREAAALIRKTALERGPVLVTEPHRVRNLFDEIQLHAAGTAAIRDRICLLLLRLLPLTINALAVEVISSQTRAVNSFARCKHYIDEHFLALHNLADVARACRMSAVTICRLFKRFGDQSPYQYLLRRKMQHAAARLQRGNVLIKEIADSMGFTDQYHFSRAFKRVHGISPQRLLEHGSISGA